MEMTPPAIGIFMHSNLGNYCGKFFDDRSLEGTLYGHSMSTMLKVMSSIRLLDPSPKGTFTKNVAEEFSETDTQGGESMKHI